MYTRSIYARMFPDLEQEPLKTPETPLAPEPVAAAPRQPLPGTPKPPGQPTIPSTPMLPADPQAAEMTAEPLDQPYHEQATAEDVGMPLDAQAMQAVSGKPIKNAFEYPFPQPANEDERKANKRAEKTYEKQIAEDQKPKFTPDPKLSPEENRLAKARFEMDNLENKDKGAKGLVRELLQNFLYGMSKAGGMPGVSVAQALTLGATGAGAGFINKKWNEQRDLEARMPELEKASAMGTQRRNLDLDNQRADAAQRLATKNYERGVLNDVSKAGERDIFEGPNGQFLKKSKTGEVEPVLNPVTGQPLTKNDVAVRLRDGRVVYTTGDKAIDREIAEDYRYAQMEMQAGKWNADELSEYEEKLDAWSQDTVKFQRDLAEKETTAFSLANEAQQLAHLASQADDPEESQKLLTQSAQKLAQSQAAQSEVAKIRDKAPPRPKRTPKSISAPGQPNRSAKPVAIPEANAAEAIRRTREKNPSLKSKSDEEIRKILADRGFTFR